jgi:hypothetical protein
MIVKNQKSFQNKIIYVFAIIPLIKYIANQEFL